MECEVLFCYEQAHTILTVNSHKVAYCNKHLEEVGKPDAEHWCDVPGAVSFEPAPN